MQLKRLLIYVNKPKSDQKKVYNFMKKELNMKVTDGLIKLWNKTYLIKLGNTKDKVKTMKNKINLRFIKV